MKRPHPCLPFAATICCSPALADSGFMGIPTDTGIGGFLVGALLIIAASAVAGALYGLLGYLLEKIRARK